MRPLYIEGKPGCRVVLDEPALRISVPDKADRLFPLARISRVVCSGSVEWTMGALLACADAGIVVLILSKTGEVRARWLGVSRDRQLFAQRLLDLLSRPDGMQRYETWRVAMQKMAARSFARRAGLHDWQVIPVADLLSGLRLNLLNDWPNAVNRVESLLYGEMTLLLLEQGLDLQDESVQANRLDLAADFSRLLLWDFYLPLLDLKSRRLKAPEEREIAQLYQHRSDRVGILFRGTVNKLHRFLMGAS
ncbi:CRISPR-associated endonuclease Cas1 [Methylotuvimicrobium sp. KM2]|uniref:CRISPR-associated endonuclease Cas1 n=1 Tax=Methylotuvimicrobium sp. KM2 TaxID=3133976 RepID=UPI0031018465